MGWLIFFVALAWLVFGSDVNPFLALPLAIVIAFVGEWIVEIFARGILSYRELPARKAHGEEPTLLPEPDQVGIADFRAEPGLIGTDVSYDEQPLDRVAHLDLPGFEFWYGHNDLEARCTKCGFRQLISPTFVTSVSREEGLRACRESDPCFYEKFANFAKRRNPDLETIAGKRFEVWSEIGELPRDRTSELRCDCGNCIRLIGPVTHNSVKSTANEHLMKYHSPSSLEEMTMRVRFTLEQGGARIPVAKRRRLEMRLDRYRALLGAGDAEQLKRAMYALEGAIRDANAFLPPMEWGRG